MSTPSTIHYLTAPCPLGSLVLATDKQGICALLLADSPAAALAELKQRFPLATLHSNGKGLRTDLERVITWVKQPSHPLQLTQPLAPQGTAFQQQVWQALQKTRPGQRLSYQQLAEQLGKPGASRAVAGACAANPLALVIPCHRVVRSDGALSGYRWGVARKQALLQAEQSASLAQAG